MLIYEAGQQFFLSSNTKADSRIETTHFGFNLSTIEFNRQIPNHLKKKKKIKSNLILPQ